MPVTSPSPVYMPILRMILYSDGNWRRKNEEVPDVDIAKFIKGDLQSQFIEFVPIGAAEEGSKIEILPVFVGRDSNQRYIHSKIKVTYLDMEAKKYMTLRGKFASNSFYQQYNGSKVAADVLCGSGLVTLVNMTYGFHWENIANRGMRFNHVLTGKMLHPEVITFQDDGWNKSMSRIQYSMPEFVGTDGEAPSIFKL